MCASQDMKSKTARVSEKIESAIRSAIKYYEEQHDLEWCDGCYDPDEINEAAEILLSAKDAEVCICIGYSLGYSDPEPLADYGSEGDHRTSRIHLHGNAVAFTVDLKEPGSCTNHENVLIPQVDPLSKGKAALFEEAENGDASAMFALSRLFDQGIGEPQDLLKPTSGTPWGWSFANSIGPARGLLTPSPIRKFWLPNFPTYWSTRIVLYIRERRSGSACIVPFFRKKTPRMASVSMTTSMRSTTSKIRQTRDGLDRSFSHNWRPPNEACQSMAFTICYFDSEAMEGDQDGTLLQDLQARTAERAVFW